MKNIIAFSLLLLSSAFAYCMENPRNKLVEYAYSFKLECHSFDHLILGRDITNTRNTASEDGEGRNAFVMAFIQLKDDLSVKMIRANEEKKGNTVLEAFFLHIRNNKEANRKEVYVTRCLDEHSAYESTDPVVCKWGVPTMVTIPKVGKWAKDTDESIIPTDFQLTVLVTPKYE